MTLEAGRLSQDLGPLTVIKGMDASVPEHELAPNNPENMFNVDVDRGGRAVNRPGSIFHARIGGGPVQGIHEHHFETGTDSPRLVAIAYLPYEEVNNLASSSDGVAGSGSGFCGDVSTNGEPIRPFLARAGDRFHIASFLDRVYFAGSTIDHKVWEFKYDFGGVLTQVSGTGMSPFVPLGTCVLAQGNRLFVAGNPDFPSRIYPSGPDDPTDWQEQLAFQVGTRNDRIVRLIEHDGLIVALAERTSSWVLAGDIPAGDVQVDDISTTHGCVGALAADEGGDGWVYWLSKTDGPVRWRRGAALDRSFAYPMADLWRKIERSNTDLSTAVVKWDPVDRAMRFEIPTGAPDADGTNVPNYLMSYFVDSNAWTHGASTQGVELATAIRDLDVLDQAMGLRRYSCLTHRRDHQDGTDKIYGGDQGGHVWVWRNESVDKVRDVSEEGEEGTDFTSLIRWGNVEISPVGYRAVIEFLLLDFIGGYEFEFDIYSDQDYAGWNLVENCVRAVDGGTLTLALDDNTGQDTSRIFAVVKAPMHVRVSNWALLIAKALRIEMRWTGSKQTMAFSGIEFERSIEPHGSAKVQTPPDPPLVPFEPVVLESGEFDGTQFFTDFSEMETGAGLPDAISEIFVDSAAARSYVISETPEHEAEPTPTSGKYFQVSRTGAGGRWGLGFDAIGTVSRAGEILCRLFTLPAVAMDTEVALGVVDNNNHARAGFRQDGVTDVLHTQARTGGSNIYDNSVSTPDPEESEWVWLRFRADDLGGGNWRYRSKMWAGDIGDEPVGWEADSGSVADTPPDGAVGWRLEISSDVIADYAYFAFSNDPDVTPPPVPTP